MEQNDKNGAGDTIYEYDSGEISFKKLFYFLKQSFLRIIIYVVAAVILVTAVSLGFKFFGETQYSASAMIEYTFSGIEEGKNPDKTGFDKDAVKSPNNINAALEATGLKNKVSADVDTVKNHIAVRSIMPGSYVAKYNELVAGGMASADAYAQLAQMVFYPSKFVIEIYGFKDMGMTEEDAIRLINELVKVHTEEFILKFSSSVVISDALFTLDSSAYDYFEYYDLFNIEYNSMRSYLSRQAADNPQFVSSSTGDQFVDLLAEMAFLETELNNFRAYVSSKPVSQDLGKVKMSLNTQIKKIQSDLDKNTQLIADIQKQLLTYSPTTETIIGDGQTTIIVKYPQEYYNLQNKLTEYIEEAAEIKHLLSQKTEFYELIKDKVQGDIPASDIAAADAQLARIKTTTVELIKKVNKLSSEFMSRKVHEQSLRIVSPAAISSANVSFPTTLAYLAGTVIALIAALIVTFAVNKYKAAKARNEKIAPKIEKA